MTTLTRSINACPSAPRVDRRKDKGRRALIDHTGDRFGRLVVVERAENWLKQVAWLCRCDCGGMNIVPGIQLRRGQVRSCGCSCRGGPHGKPIKGRSSPEQSPGLVAVNSLLAVYQSNARRRGLEWGLSRDQFTELIRSDCEYCGGEPRAKKKDGGHGYLLYNGIDRSDSGGGYIPENSVPCCRSCNQSKGTKSAEEFRAWVLRIARRYHHLVCPSEVAS